MPILLLSSHRYCLFSTDGIEKDLPGRFSRLLQLPVSRGDGVSEHYSRKCVEKLNSVEKTIAEMKLLANSSYSKAGYAASISSSPLTRERSRKRAKNTSGDTASPHTALARPIA